MRDIYAFWKTPKCSTGARVIQLKDSDERQSLQNGELQGRPRAVREWLLTFLDGIQDPHCINISGHILSELLHPHFVRWGQIIYMLLALLLFGSFAHTQRLQTFVPLLFFFRTHHTLCWCSECSDRYKMSALHYFGPFSARCSFLESHQRQKNKIKERQNWDTGWERQHLTHDSCQNQSQTANFLVANGTRGQVFLWVLPTSGKNFPGVYRIQENICFGSVNNQVKARVNSSLLWFSRASSSHFLISSQVILFHSSCLFLHKKSRLVMESVELEQTNWTFFLLEVVLWKPLLSLALNNR